MFPHGAIFQHYSILLQIAITRLSLLIGLRYNPSFNRGFATASIPLLVRTGLFGN